MFENRPSLAPQEGRDSQLDRVFNVDLNRAESGRKGPPDSAFVSAICTLPVPSQ